MSDWYRLGPNHELIPYDIFKEPRIFEDADRVVQQTGNRTRWISTVFLGLDHRYSDKGRPIVFETMVFQSGASGDEGCERYCTWDEAVRGHRRWVKKVFKNHPHRNGRAMNGDFTTPKKMLRARARRNTWIKRGSEALTRLAVPPKGPQSV